MHNSSMQLLLSTTLAFVLILAAAQICGRLAPLFRQPAVVGEMTAGILLGPTALGWVFPEFSEHVFSADVKRTLYVTGMVGLGVYMFLVGAEHESPRMRNGQRFLPLILGLVGFILPVSVGAAVATWLAGELKPGGINDQAYVLFVGVGLSITAFPMLARMLQERQMMKTRFGSTAIKAAAIDDALAWCGLAVVGALATNGSFIDAVLKTILPSILFVALAFAVVPMLFRQAAIRAVASGRMGDSLLSSLLILVLLACFITDYIGLYSVFGGFIIGAALPRVAGFAELLRGRLLQVVRCWFLPIFFAYAGLNADIGRVFNASTFAVLVGLLVVAIGAKAISSATVLRFYRWPVGEAVAMAGLMNARGLMILVYVTIGLSLGIIDQAMYSIMVLIAAVTTALAMPLYRSFFTARREAEARADWDMLSSHDIVPDAPLIDVVATKD